MKKLADRIKRVGLIGNSEKVAAAPAVQRAARLVTATGRAIYSDPATASLARLKAVVCPDAATLARRVDLLVVFGGDGTMLRVAREIAGSRTPILGVNVGGLGFLTAVPSSNLSQALRCVWNGQFRYESRVLIQATGCCHDKQVNLTALNDIVIGRGIASRLIELDVSVDGDPLTRYRCDVQRLVEA